MASCKALASKVFFFQQLGGNYVAANGGGYLDIIVIPHDSHSYLYL